MDKFLRYGCVCFITLLISACQYYNRDSFGHEIQKQCRHVNDHISRRDEQNMTALSRSIDHQYRVHFHPFQTDKQYLLAKLYQHNIQFIQYRDIMTMVIPTDQYYNFNSSVLDDRNYEGINYAVQMLRHYPCSTIYVAAFSDNVGDQGRYYRLTHARAESMVTFLWAHGIYANNLRPAGFASMYPIADNNTVRGSAMNRRIELQWTTQPDETMGMIDRH
ncbi:MAG: OmpA family protein [Gammaproteobacteria bacterium]|nr:OmpA family protein [Gammaproteobacteria bacterium]